MGPQTSTRAHRYNEVRFDEAQKVGQTPVAVAFFLLGVVFVVVGIGVSIALHEIGHLVPAKLFGVRVTRYMIGFGPTLWSRKKGETEYGIKAVPAGGYISMIGMFPPNTHDVPTVTEANTGREAEDTTTGTASIVAQARAQNPAAFTPRGIKERLNTLSAQARQLAHEDVGPGDENRVFYRLPMWKKIIVMFGGPAMNLLIGVVLLGGILVFYGLPQITTTVASVSSCERADAKPGQADCVPSPAAVAGFRQGDTVIEFNGRQVTSWEQLSQWIRESPGTSVPVVVQREGQEVTLTLTPTLIDKPVVGTNGAEERDPSGNPVTEPVGFAGFSPTQQIVPQPLSAVLPQAWQQISTLGGVILTLPQRLGTVAQAAFTDAPRDPNGPLSVVGVGRVAGEVASAEQAPVTARFIVLLQLLAGLNFALAVFNLIPLLPLDGGHIAGALYEGLRRQLAKLTRRRDPGPVDTAKLLPVTYAVAVVLIAMGALLIYADIVKPISIFG